MNRNPNQQAATARHAFGDFARAILAIAIIGGVIWRVVSAPDLSFLPFMACGGLLLSWIAVWSNRVSGLDDEQEHGRATSGGVRVAGVNRSFPSRCWQSPSMARRPSASRRTHFRVRRDWRHRR
jgi:hypothetical protein